jgi:class 3 adenylate cyclase
MEPREQRLVIIIADISGYTQFMVENQLAAVHGQLCITFLIETILREVDIPLQLQEIEGDAVFLYAAHPGEEAAWRDVLAQVRTKLVRFFDAFIEGMITAGEATPCKCAICRNAQDLRLKVIVHSGRAVFHKIRRFSQVSGTDVILAHQLLKNSVPSSEYLLMTDTAYRDLGREMDGEFLEGTEVCDGFGSVKTYVQLMGEAVERSRNALYAMPPKALASRALGYVIWDFVEQPRALLEQMRHPVARVGWVRRAGFAFVFTLVLPVSFLLSLFLVPLRLLSRRAIRRRASRRDIAVA